MGQKVWIEVGADVKKAVQGLNSVERQMKSLAGQARAMRNIAVGVTGVVAIRQVVTGLHSLTKAAQEEVAGQVRLQRAITNTGRVVDTELIGSLERWVTAQEEATGFADDEVRSSLSVLVAQTEDLAEAQRRSALAADLAVAFDMDLVTASKMLGKVTDENIGSLRRLGIALPDVGEGYTDAMANADTAAELAQKAGISFEGAMKLVKSGGKDGESVLKRYGVAMRQAAKGSEISADQVLGAVEKAVGGQSRDRMAALGPSAQLANNWKNLGDEVGAVFVPIFARGSALALRGVKGLRRVVALFTTDLSGPKIGSARKIWKAVFGEEMPNALGIVVDSFDKIGGRIKTFVDDLNSTDDASARNAVTKLFAGFKTDIADGMTKLGEELDKHGAIGFAVKVLATSFAFGAANAATIGVAEKVFGLLKDVLQVTWLSVALLGSGPVLSIAAGILLGVGAVTVIDSITERWRTAEGVLDVVKKALFFGGIFVASAAAVAGFPVVAAVGLGVVIGIGALEITSEVDFGDLGSKFLDMIIPHLPFGVSHIAGALKMVIPIVVEWVIGGSPNPPQAKPPPGEKKREEDRNTRRVGGGDRPATLDDIYAAFTNNHGYMPEFEWAKGILALGPMWSEVQGLAKGGIVPASPGGTLARIGEGGEAEIVAPLSKAREMGFGGGSLEVHVEVHGSVIGIGDLEQRVRAAVRDGVLSGGFRGVLAPAGGR